MKDLRLGEELVSQLRHPRPHQPCLLAAPAQLPVPENGDVVAECADRRAVGRHGVVGEISGDDLAKPVPGFRDRPVPTLSQPLLDFPQFRAHAVPAWLPPDLEVAPPGFAADQHKAQEREGPRLAKPALLAVLRRIAAEHDQAGLVRVQRQRELPQPVAHRVPEAPSVVLMLEADHQVVGIPDHDHVARGLAPSPALGPKVEDVMKIDVRE
jgi:hypothetical protein